MTRTPWNAAAGLGRLLALVVVAVGGDVARAQAPGTPIDVDDLLRRARAQAVANGRLYHDYSFRESVLDETLDEKGQVVHSERSVYRVFPFVEGTERQLLEKDGAPPPPRLVRKQEAQNEKLRRHVEKQQARERRLLEGRARAAAKSRATGPPRGTTAGATPKSTAVAPAAAPVTPPPATVSPPSLVPTPASLPVPDAAPTAAPSPPSLPECDLAAPASRVAPPAPGSRAQSNHPQRMAPPEARRSRDSASDYTLFELLSLTRYEYVGACRLGDRAVHVVAFRPPDDFDPVNPVERVMAGMAGAIFIDADETQVIRAEGRTVAPLKWGGGLIALREAHVIFESRKVNDEVWLPWRDVFEFDARVLASGQRDRTTNVYDDYKKIAVTTSEEVQGLAPSQQPP